MLKSHLQLGLCMLKTVDYYMLSIINERDVTEMQAN